MKHVLIAFALLAVPFAHAEKVERRPSSTNSFKDGSSVETVWVYGSTNVIQIHDASGRTCYGLAGNEGNPGTS
ncbi:hypothetical protein ABTE32_21515, partial [Acinetobacter baumannii]